MMIKKGREGRKEGASGSKITVENYFLKIKISKYSSSV